MSPEIQSYLRSDSVMFEYDVHDMARAAAWYCDLFGFEITFQGGTCHTEFALPVSGARLALSLCAPDKKIEQAARLFLPVSDALAAADCLKAKGIATRIEQVENVVRIVWVEDPEGNRLAFEQWLNR